MIQQKARPNESIHRASLVRALNELLAVGSPPATANPFELKRNSETANAAKEWITSKGVLRQVLRHSVATKGRRPQVTCVSHDPLLDERNRRRIRCSFVVWFLIGPPNRGLALPAALSKGGEHFLSDSAVIAQNYNRVAQSSIATAI